MNMTAVRTESAMIEKGTDLRKKEGQLLFTQVPQSQLPHPGRGDYTSPVFEIEHFETGGRMFPFARGSAYFGDIQPKIRLQGVEKGRFTDSGFTRKHRYVSLKSCFQIFQTFAGQGARYNNTVTDPFILVNLVREFLCLCQV